MSLLFAVYAPSFSEEYRILLEKEIQRCFPLSGGTTLFLSEDPYFSKEDGIITFSPLDAVPEGIPVVSIGGSDSFPAVLPDFYHGTCRLLSSLRERESFQTVSAELEGYPFHREVENAVHDYLLDHGLQTGRDLVLVSRDAVGDRELDIRKALPFAFGPYLKEAVSLLVVLLGDKEHVPRDRIIPVEVRLPRGRSLFLERSLGELCPSLSGRRTQKKEDAFLCLEDGPSSVSITFPTGTLSVPRFLLERELLQKKLLGFLEEGKAPSSKALLLSGQLLSYLEEHYGEVLSREQVASLFCCSGDYLERVFHSILGISLWGYLLELRIEKAKAYLGQEEYSMGEVASLAGFSSAAYFSRTFRAATGVSPTQYRKTIQAND